MSSVGLILLAAGASTRMGTPKQLLPWQGRSLVQQAAMTAIASLCDPVVVVLGANAIQIQPQLAALPLQVIHNPAWKQGLSTSLQVGITALQQASPDLAAVVIMLCDQPLVTAHLLNQLVTTYHTSTARIVAAAYAETLGVPALFDRQYFATLMTLTGDTGARRLLQRYRAEVVAIPAPEAAIDLDTPQDYDQWHR